MKIKSHIRSVQLIFSIFMFLIFAGLTGCKDDGAEFLEKELVQEESTETSGVDLEQEDPTDAESGVSEKKSEEKQVDTVQETAAAKQQPEISYGSRVFQAIEKAGGYLPEAAASYLNRAKGLSDGQQIYVPTQAEVDSQMIQVTEDGQEATSETAPGNNNEEGSAGENTGTDQKINLNTADVSQLTTLTGVGESKALAIIAYREENGPFTSIEDIMNVPGIKEGTYEKIKDKIAIK